ncbi:hypothetical protein Taro_046898 [Colocasia esculenta]|uniref:Uncharacterized protein n=1 Tax=Colocasia esculenta TaxID=4460 RepID=A0A843WTR0_COLES|nr:hypothetical protein [Colocasia esculenta]
MKVSINNQTHKKSIIQHKELS